jgi:hypothetical protein
MMKKLIMVTLGLLFLHMGSIAQTTTEVETPSEISEVTLFLQGAQIQRTATAELTNGKTLLILKNLSPVLDPKSIQVKITGTPTLLTVNHFINFLSDAEESDELQAFDNRIEALKDSIDVQKALLETLEEELAFLKANRSIKGAAENLTSASLRETYSFYSGQTREVLLEQLEVKKKIKALEAEQQRWEQQRKEFFKDPDLRKSEIQILLSSERSMEVKLEVSYLCSGAGWFPNYDIIAKDVESPVQILYKASVYQRTGEDWDQVKLSLSNADPYKSGSLPFLEPLYLNYNNFVARNQAQASASPLAYGGNRKIEGVIKDNETGEPLIGVNILVKGTSVGTVTGFDGRYSLNLPEGATSVMISYLGYNTKEVDIQSSGKLDLALIQTSEFLDEVVVTGYGKSDISSGRLAPPGPSSIKEERIIPVNPIENQTTISFEVDLPFSIPSNGESFQVELAQYDIPAYFEYQCAPKVEKEPFLVAKIVEWDQYNLLEGEANIFFEDLYLGRSILDVRFVTDTLDISLGRDKGILVNREKVRDFYKENFIGNKKVESRAFLITVQNNKAQTVNIILKDQIPVSRMKDIEVQKVDLGDGLLNETTGEVSWPMRLAPGEKKEINLQYSVKFDRFKKLRIE